MQAALVSGPIEEVSFLRNPLRIRLKPSLPLILHGPILVPFNKLTIFIIRSVGADSVLRIQQKLDQ